MSLLHTPRGHFSPRRQTRTTTSRTIVYHRIACVSSANCKTSWNMMLMQSELIVRPEPALVCAERAIQAASSSSTIPTQLCLRGATMRVLRTRTLLSSQPPNGPGPPASRARKWTEWTAWTSWTPIPKVFRPSRPLRPFRPRAVWGAGPSRRLGRVREAVRSRHRRWCRWAGLSKRVRAGR